MCIAYLGSIVSLALLGLQISIGVEPVSLGFFMLAGLLTLICGLIALIRAFRNPESRQRVSAAAGFGLGTLMTVIGIFLLLALLSSGE